MAEQLHSPVKFLLVDDRDDNLIVLDAVLQRDGLELLKAASAREALELLLEHDVALALIDVQMPEMDGFELAETIRSSPRTRHVPIVLVTAGEESVLRKIKGYGAGAMDFLFKPIEPEILRQKAAAFFDIYVQKQTLARSLRLNEELMAVIGHDLRNPLNAILLTAELLSSVQDPDAQKAATRLRTNGQRMLQIIQEIFDLSKARLDGAVSIECAAVDLNQVAKAAVASNPSQSIEIRRTGDLTGEWDAARLEQVFSALVRNASGEGATDTSVVIAMAGEGPDVVVSIHDKNHIPEALLSRIFEPFQMSMEPRTRTEGLGLGIYIALQIVMAHGGTLNVESTLEGGTTFRMRLPRRTKKVRTRDRPSDPLPPPAHPAN